MDAENTQEVAWSYQAKDGNKVYGDTWDVKPLMKAWDYFGRDKRGVKVNEVDARGYNYCQRYIHALQYEPDEDGISFAETISRYERKQRWLLVAVCLLSYLTEFRGQRSKAVWAYPQTRET